MKYRSGMIAAAGALMLGVMGVSPARADSVLYDSAGFVGGTQSFMESFDLTQPGTLTVSLTNVAWPQQLASLSLFVSSTNATLGEMGAGTESFSTGPGEIFTQWFGTAQGPLNTGVYAVKVSWAPNPVPLPTSVALLLSGLALLLWQRRNRIDLEPSGSATSDPSREFSITEHLRALASDPVAHEFNMTEHRRALASGSPSHEFGITEHLQAH